MGSVTAQGLVEDVKWLTQVVQNAKEGKDQSTDDSTKSGKENDGPHPFASLQLSGF